MFLLRPRLVRATATLFLLGACGDNEEVRVSSGTVSSAAEAGAPATIRVGMPLDSLYAIIGTGPFTGADPADTIRVMHGHRARMLVTSNRLLRIILVRTAGGGTVDTPVNRGQDIPIVIEGQRVLGNGWADFDRLQKELGLPIIDGKP